MDHGRLEALGRPVDHVHLVVLYHLELLDNLDILYILERPDNLERLENLLDQ